MLNHEKLRPGLVRMGLALGAERHAGQGPTEAAHEFAAGAIELIDALTGDLIARETVRAYLDECIVRWRGERDAAEAERDQGRHHTAACYVDAFQSARVSLLGELLPDPRREETPDGR